jgi:hypothetical protein
LAVLRVTGLDVGHQFLEVVEHHFAAVLAFQRTRQGAANGGGQQLLGGVLRFWQAQGLGEGAVDDLRRARSALSRAGIGVALGRMGIGQDVARQRAHFHGMAAPAGRLDPRVFGALVDVLDVGAVPLVLAPNL